jgi:hypothetical protein
MKDNFLNLIHQVESIEAKFHNTSSSRGFSMPSLRVIHDVPDFQRWIQSVQMELQEIVDRTGDKFASDTLEASKQNYDGWNDKKYFDILKGKLLAMKDNIDKYYITPERETAMLETNPPKIFISHSSRDKDYVAKIVELLDGMGLDQTQVFCSSLPGYDIPVDTDIFDYLRSQFTSYNLHVFFIHSVNYYQSAVSLNEMGAAWALRSDYTSFLLPGFGFEGMQGVVNNQTIAIKLDHDETEVKDKLNQLYAKIVDEFGITRKADIIWEKKRDRFIKEVRELPISEVAATTNAEDDLEMLESGVYIRKSDASAGKKIYYCPACYQNHKKLFPIVQGSMARDRFCSNCKMHFRSM